MNIKIYTDGSCLGNPGAGGYAAIIIDEIGRREEIVGGEKFTTNNRMELMAAIVALKKISVEDSVELFTDSSYLQNAFTQNWLVNWKRRGWKAAGGGAVKNQDLWRELDELISKRHVKFNWVKGHAGNSLNERCDILARTTAEKFKSQKNNRTEIFKDVQSATLIEKPKYDTHVIAKQEGKVEDKVEKRKWDGNQLLLFSE